MLFFSEETFGFKIQLYNRSNFQTKLTFLYVLSEPEININFVLNLNNYLFIINLFLKNTQFILSIIKLLNNKNILQ